MCCLSRVCYSFSLPQLLEENKVNKKDTNKAFRDMFQKIKDDKVNIVIVTLTLIVDCVVQKVYLAMKKIIDSQEVEVPEGTSDVFGKFAVALANMEKAGRACFEVA